MASEGNAASSPRPLAVPSSGKLRRIVHWPDPVLLRRAAPVATIDDRVRGLLADMVRVMREEEGAGLAAPQVGESARVFIVEARVEEDGRPAEPLGVYINPRIVAMEGPVEPFEEGCLSLPEIRVDIRRPPKVTIEALDADGNPFSRTDAGILARIWQHEFDHLEGTLILDRMTPIDQLATKKRLKELREAYETR